jgi:hypothetical protein
MKVAGCCLSNRHRLRDGVERPRPAYRQTERHGSGSNQGVAHQAGLATSVGGEAIEQTCTTRTLEHCCAAAA